MDREHKEVHLQIEWPEAEEEKTVTPHNLKKILATQVGEALENIEFGYVTAKGRIMTVYTRHGDDPQYDSVTLKHEMVWWALFNPGAGMRPKLGCPKCE